MPRPHVKPTVSPGRAPHRGKRPAAVAIGPKVKCRQPMPSRRKRKTAAARGAKPIPLLGPPAVPVPPIPRPPGVPPETLKAEAEAIKSLDWLHAVGFCAACAFMLRGSALGAAVAMAIGTFAPMAVRRGMMKWREKICSP